MILKQIISGGQTGADQAALNVAKDYGLATGGFAPYQYKTNQGCDLSLRDDFGLVEIPGGYKDRTYKNVEGSDGTIRLAFDFASPGERCTLNAITHFGRPYLDIELNEDNVHAYTHLESTALWIVQNKIEVLNVAGNAEERIKEETGHSMFSNVYSYLAGVFAHLERLDRR